MKTFFYLVRLEYKKLFQRRSTKISLTILILFVLLIGGIELTGSVYVNDEILYNNYENMKAVKKESRQFFGRPLDYPLLKEALDHQNSKPETDPDDIDGAIAAYKKYDIPYQDIQMTTYNMDIPFNEDLPTNMPAYRKDSLKGYYSSLVSADTLTQVLNQNEKMEQIYDYKWTKAYNNFLKQMSLIGFAAGIIITICLSSMFSGEYTSRMDALVLSTRYGKNKLNGAKLFTGITFAAVISICVGITSFLELGLLYGFDGASADVQLIFPYLVKSMNCGTAALIFSFCLLLSAVFVAALTMLLSAKSPTPATVIIIMFLFLFLPILFSFPPKYMLLHAIYKMLPTNITSILGAFHLFYKKIGGGLAYGFQYAPFVYAAVCSVFTFFSYRIFKNYQVRN